LPAAAGQRAMTRANTVQDARRLLEESDLFRSLTPEERQRILVHAHLHRFAVGETIFLKGSAGQGMMAVLSGEVRLSVPSTEGKEIVLAILHPGEVFGEIALLDGKERTADAVAVTPCEIATLERRDLLPLLRQQPELCMKLLEGLCHKLRRTTAQVEEVLFLQLPTRLAKTLLKMAVRRVSPTGVGLQIRLSQRELGSMIGGTRESVNKCLNDWQRRGIIRIKDGVVVVVDIPGLKRLAEAEGHSGTQP
jgi:CRP/FNR family transcriptional regulator, cyclic AMP receptor protein